MKKLQLTFLNENGNKHTFTPNIASDDLSAETVQTQMEAMTELGIFERSGVKLFTEIDSAKYVETIETKLF